MLTVICVRTGNKYGIEYVEKLRAMVGRHLSIPHRFVCLTDQPDTCDGVEFIDISRHGLVGWYAKLLVFNREVSGPGRLLYFDLDMVICGNIDALAALAIPMGICENFTKIRQERSGASSTWNCAFGSCVMLLSPNYGQPVWDSFDRNRQHHIEKAGRMGDQKIIENIGPAGVTILQDLLPPGFFCHYKDFMSAPDSRAAVLVFAGNQKPHNTSVPWARDLWR